MELADFKNFKTLYDTKLSSNPPFVNRKKNVNNQPVLLSTCVMLQGKQEHIGKLFYKTDFNDKNMYEVDFLRNRRTKATFPENLKQVSSKPLPSTKQTEVQ